MSQRASGYARCERDLYETPEWVTAALVPHLPARVTTIWEPAAGSGQMVFALRSAGFTVVASDINSGHDFLADRPARHVDAVVTNPPFGLAREFIEHALKLTEPDGCVAMLLRADYDHAKTRAHLFGDCVQFAKKVALTRRIVWFERPGAAPSFNHCWLLWDWKHTGPPALAYAPTESPRPIVPGFLLPSKGPTC